MTILVLIFGEITPKSLAAQNSEKIALKVARPISIITFILNPHYYSINLYNKWIYKNTWWRN